MEVLDVEACDVSPDFVVVHVLVDDEDHADQRVACVGAVDQAGLDDCRGGKAAVELEEELDAADKERMEELVDHDQVHVRVEPDAFEEDRLGYHQQVAHE